MFILGFNVLYKFDTNNTAKGETRYGVGQADVMRICFSFHKIQVLVLGRGIESRDFSK